MRLLRGRCRLPRCLPKYPLDRRYVVRTIRKLVPTYGFIFAVNAQEFCERELLVRKARHTRFTVCALLSLAIVPRILPTYDSSRTSSSAQTKGTTRTPT